LPREGLLSFFYDSEQGVWGFDPAERGAWRVLCTGAEATVTRRATPDEVPDDARYGAVRLVPTVEVSHTGFESDEFEALGMSDDEQLAYVEATEDVDSLAHRMLGYPDTIQGDMRFECQLVSHGLYAGDTSAYEGPRASELKSGSAEWQLLLQVDSDPDAQMMWGDGGRLYFWMSEDAIRGRDWESAWMILQCY
ncbi:MAG TPA: YwqG family protein, partial [Acidimicrobiia bacterium]